MHKLLENTDLGVSAVIPNEEGFLFEWPDYKPLLTSGMLSTMGIDKGRLVLSLQTLISKFDQTIQGANAIQRRLWITWYESKKIPLDTVNVRDLELLATISIALAEVSADYNTFMPLLASELDLIASITPEFEILDTLVSKIAESLGIIEKKERIKECIENELMAYFAEITEPTDKPLQVSLETPASNEVLSWFQECGALSEGIPEQKLDCIEGRAFDKERLFQEGLAIISNIHAIVEIYKNNIKVPELVKYRGSGAFAIQALELSGTVEGGKETAHLLMVDGVVLKLVAKLLAIMNVIGIDTFDQLIASSGATIRNQEYLYNFIPPIIKYIQTTGRNYTQHDYTFINSKLFEELRTDQKERLAQIEGSLLCTAGIPDSDVIIIVPQNHPLLPLGKMNNTTRVNNYVLGGFRYTPPKEVAEIYDAKFISPTHLSILDDFFEGNNTAGFTALAKLINGLPLDEETQNALVNTWGLAEPDPKYTEGIRLALFSPDEEILGPFLDLSNAEHPLLDMRFKLMLDLYKNKWVVEAGELGRYVKDQDSYVHFPSHNGMIPMAVMIKLGEIRNEVEKNNGKVIAAEHVITKPKKTVITYAKFATKSMIGGDSICFGIPSPRVTSTDTPEVQGYADTFYLGLRTVRKSDLVKLTLKYINEQENPEISHILNSIKDLYKLDSDEAAIKRWWDMGRKELQELLMVPLEN